MLPHLEVLFPNLKREGYKKKSDKAFSYNCIAFAAGDPKKWWWPDCRYLGFWPKGITRSITVASFAKVFEALGFITCKDDTVEPGFEKIAIYVDNSGEPTHAAKQTKHGKWISKIGRYEDIEHNSLKALEDTDYGKAAFFLKKPVKSR